MIQGKTVRLRALERRHLEATRVWANDPELARLLDRAWPVSDQEHEAWFADLRERRDRVFFAIETHDEGRHIGNIWLWGIDWRHRKAEVRVILGEATEFGKGYGSESITLLSQYAFERLNLHRLFAYVLAINPRARRAFERAGFVLEGTLRQDRWTGQEYSDVFLLGLLS